MGWKGGAGFHTFFGPFIKGMKGVFVRLGLRIFLKFAKGLFLGKGKVSLFVFEGDGPKPFKIC
jgi:hypothetical protein